MEDKNNPNSRSPTPWPSWPGQEPGEEPSHDYVAQELPQKEKEVREKKLSQEGDDVGYDIWDKPLPSVITGDPQICPQEGPSSATVGTEVAAEAVPDLPSVAPALLNPTDSKPASAALARAAEGEEPQEPLTPEEAKAEGSPASEEQVPPAGTESAAPAPHSPSEGKQVLLDTDQQMPSVVLSQGDLEIQGSGQQLEEEHDLDQSMAAEMEAAVTGEREEIPFPAPQSPCCSPSPSQAQMVLPQKRPSLVRRALGALHRLLLWCLVGQPED